MMVKKEKKFEQKMQDNSDQKFHSMLMNI